MKKAVSFLLSFLFVVSLSACGTHTQNIQPDSEKDHMQETTSALETDSAVKSDKAKSPQDDAVTKLKIEVGGQIFTATLEQNDATTALIAMLPVTLSMSDYSGFEKVGSLGANLPTNNAQTTTQAGDIVLYNGNQIVIFYGSNSWSYTRLAHVDDLTGWVEALGSGDVTVTFSAQ